MLTEEEITAIKEQIKECRGKLKSWKLSANYQAIDYYEQRILDLYEMLEENDVKTI